MVESDAAGAIEKNQRRRGAGPVKIEVLFTHWDGNILQCRVEMLPDLFYVGEFVFGLRVFPLGGVSIELGGGE